MNEKLPRRRPLTRQKFGKSRNFIGLKVEPTVATLRVQKYRATTKTAKKKLEFLIAVKMALVNDKLLSLQEVSRQINVTLKTIDKWSKNYRKQGLEKFLQDNRRRHDRGKIKFYHFHVLKSLKAFIHFHENILKKKPRFSRFCTLLKIPISSNGLYKYVQRHPDFSELMLRFQKKAGS